MTKLDIMIENLQTARRVLPVDRHGDVCSPIYHLAEVHLSGRPIAGPVTWGPMTGAAGTWVAWSVPAAGVTFFGWANAAQAQEWGCPAAKGASS